MTQARGIAHVDDGTLVRYLDGESGAAERETVEQHLATCGTCTARHEELVRRSEMVRTALRTLDTGPRGRSGIPRWIRWAAVVVVLLGVAGGVRPVRAWIVDGAQAIWAAVAGRAPAPAQDRAPPPPAPTASVSFAPAGNAFLVELASYQERGVLRIETAERSTAEAEIVGGDGTEDLLVLPAGLRIVNAVGSDASYVLRLPRSLDTIRVVLGTDPPRVVEPRGATSRWEIDLSGTRPEAGPSESSTPDR